MAQSRTRVITARETRHAHSSGDRPATAKNCPGICLNTVSRQADTSHRSSARQGMSIRLAGSSDLLAGEQCTGFLPHLGVTGAFFHLPALSVSA